MHDVLLNLRIAQLHKQPSTDDSQLRHCFLIVLCHGVARLLGTAPKFALVAQASGGLLAFLLHFSTLQFVVNVQSVLLCTGRLLFRPRLRQISSQKLQRELSVRL